MKEALTQKEFVEKYNAGQKEFTGVLMQFFDVSDMKLHDLTIKNSEVLFCSFRNCDLKNVKINDCKIYLLNFYTGMVADICFDRCDIEQMLFDTFSFKSAKFIRCNIRWSGILNSNYGNVDMSTSSQYKFFTDLSQVTRRDMEDMIKITMQDIERLDIGLRLKVKEMIRQDIDHYNLPNPEDKKDSYGSMRTGADSPLTYGEVKGLVEASFGAYNKPENYKSAKHPYERKDKYK